MASTSTTLGLPEPCVTCSGLIGVVVPIPWQPLDANRAFRVVLVPDMNLSSEPIRSMGPELDRFVLRP